MQMVQECPHCGTDARCRKRDFSEQTWSVLLAWGEIEKVSVDQPLCDSCYGDLRDILIDRADDVSVALVNPGKSQPASAAQKTTKKTAVAAVASKKKPAARTKGKKTSKVA